MALNEAQLRELSQLVDTLQALPHAARAAWLDALGPEHAAYKPMLQELLATGEEGTRTRDFLATLPKFGADATPDADGLEPGVAVGPYRLLRELGRGGMGTVWLAERNDGTLKRTVALKLPHSTLPQRRLAERLARERDILAGLAHPNIAHLYDAGVTPEGRPYLALEYVEGEPLLARCDRLGLDLRARIGLYLQVLAAVQYAHGRLIVHRDLKPTNILVTAQSDVKLLDFGIAKLLSDGEARETELTQLGGRALTLWYASPEQVLGLPLGTASDVYSLGVVLYELLVGSLPYRVKRDSRAQVEEAIVDADTMRTSQAQVDAAKAKQRGTTVTRLHRALAGDLDTILAKALKKDPVERYGTVDALAADLRRYLAGEPVQARPDSLWYRVRKFVERHAVGLAVGIAFAAVVVAAAALSIWQASVAREQAALARNEAATAKAVQGFLLDIFNASRTTQADPLKAQQTTARELLDLGTSRVDSALSDVPASRLEVMATLADMYTQLGLEAQAAQLQRRRVELARATYGARDARVAKALLAYVQTLQESNQRAEIPTLLDEALAILEASGERGVDMQGEALLVAAHYGKYESLLRAQQAADGAVAYFLRYAPGDDGLVTAYILASRARINAYDFDGGVAQAEKAIDAARRQGAGASAWLATPITTLAAALRGQMKLEQSEASCRAAVELNTNVHGDAHPDTLRSKIVLGNELLRRGRTSEGSALHDVVRTAMRANDPRYVAQWRSFAAGQLNLLQMDRGRPDLMAPVLQAEIQELGQMLPNSPLLADLERTLAEAQALLGDIGTAHRTLSSAEARWKRFAAGVATPLSDAAYAISRARVELAAGNLDAAWELLGSSRPAAPTDRISLDIERARALHLRGRPKDSLAAAQSALNAIAALPEGFRPVAAQAEALLERGRALSATGDAAGATASLEAALALRRAHDLPGSVWHEQTALALADAWTARGRNDLARPLRAEAERLSRAR